MRPVPGAEPADQPVRFDRSGRFLFVAHRGRHAAHRGGSGGVYYGNIHLVIDLDRVVGFDWDEGNARKNERHGVSQVEAEDLFFDPRLLVAPDPRHSTAEPRLHALGETSGGRKLHVTFTTRFEGTRIRVISARDMHRKERVTYEATP